MAFRPCHNAIASWRLFRNRSRDRQGAVAAVAAQLLLIALAAGLVSAAPLPYYCVLSADAGAWPEILSSIGLVRQPANLAHVFVARTGTPASNEWNERVAHGAILILEGESSLAEMFGFRRGAGFVKVGSLIDVHRPGLAIVWEKGLELPVFDLPRGAVVFARERWTGAPIMAGLRRGAGILLWVAVPPGERGYERFPYLLQALADLGMERSFSSPRLWAFFDSAYRSRVDLDYFAARWRASGVAALHVAAWHFWEADPEQDAYLEKLIAACHREGILVYAWLELPHVSEKFWTAHPEWREKTAILQDAQPDWRKLMNLTNRVPLPRRGRRCRVAGGKQLLMTRGALTTFSIANDVAKYFAIIPAMFAGTFPVLQALNVMHLATPQSAILSAVIFNALIIVALIPLALRGVKYIPQGAAILLRRNLVVYGFGGVIVPFIGIKLIDLLIVRAGLA